jgi:acetate kinase
MTENNPWCVLTINSGSSSLKFAVCKMEPAEMLLFRGSVERIGLKGSRFCVRDAQGKPLLDEHCDLHDHEAALEMLLARLQERLPERRLDGVGHRVVHGGAQYTQPHPITPELLAILDTLVRLAPEHLPHEL